MFRVFYRSAIRSVPFRLADAGEEFFWSFSAAAAIHAVLLFSLFWLVEVLAAHIDVPPLKPSGGLLKLTHETLLFLIGPSTVGNSMNQAVDDLAVNAGRVTMYITLASIVGGFLGSQFHDLIERYHWEIWHPTLIDPNPWKNVLSGRDFVLDYLRNNKKGNSTPSPQDIAAALERVSVRFVSAVVCVCGSPYIFNGFLEGYELNENGGLDRLIMTQAFRFKFPTRWTKDFEEKLRQALEAPAEIRKAMLDHAEAQKDDLGFFFIAGDKLVLQYQDVMTLNIHFIKVKPPTAAQQKAPATA